MLLSLNDQCNEQTSFGITLASDKRVIGSIWSVSVTRSTVSLSCIPVVLVHGEGYSCYLLFSTSGYLNFYHRTVGTL